MPQSHLRGVPGAALDEHLRQHGGRLTGADMRTEVRVKKLAEGAPEARHLLPAAGPALTDNR
ncbi:hypothetical protein [Micromonospora sp. NPDC005707]|uniref:hypothetical protein n=1 Tax=Micromonospora sp. NPDC005707 TaxID=3157050 RepID=UPI0033C7B268